MKNEIRDEAPAVAPVSPPASEPEVTAGSQTVEGLVFAFSISKSGASQRCGWEEIAQWKRSAAEGIWIHLDASDPAASDWLYGSSGLSELECDALLAVETRPRAMDMPDGLLVVLRGVNLNPTADPEDMVALRIWVEPYRVITMRRRPVRACQDLRGEFEAGRGPSDCGEVLVALADRLAQRVQPVVTDIEDEVDSLEGQLLKTASGDLRRTLAELRRQTVVLRRHLGPQREALAQLQSRGGAVLSSGARMHLREVADAFTRYVEDLDSIRDRAAVIHEELSGRLSENMNRTMYVLTLVASIFLPLGFVTGLLGINVGGMPGADSPLAFAIVTAGLVLLATIQAIVFRWLRYI